MNRQSQLKRALLAAVLSSATTAMAGTANTWQACRITVGDSGSENVIPVRSYRMVLNAYVNNPESKFNGSDGRRCGFATRGMLQQKQVIAGEHLYCGKEIKRKLEQGLVDHEIDAKVKTYSNGRVAADESIKNDIRLFGTREPMRRGIGQHTIERALDGHIRLNTYKKIVAAVDEYKREKDKLEKSERTTQKGS